MRLRVLDLRRLLRDFDLRRLRLRDLRLLDLRLFDLRFRDFRLRDLDLRLRDLDLRFRDFDLRIRDLDFDLAVQGSCAAGVGVFTAASLSLLLGILVPRGGASVEKQLRACGTGICAEGTEATGCGGKGEVV